MAPVIPLTPAELEVASRVLTGPMACELNQHVQLTPVDGKPGHFALVLKKTTYTLVPQETTTGAVRLEDRGAGIVWLQIPAKSMLLNARNGKRLVDGCQHEDQRLAAAQPSSALGIIAEPAAAVGGPPVVTAALAGAQTQAAMGPLIPRRVLFGPPQRSGASISPDGQWLAWIAPREGVPNVWLAPAAAPDDSRPITEDRQRGVQSFSFARDGRHLLYARDEDGGENLQVHAFDLTGGGVRAISPKGSRATIAGLSDARAGEVLLSINEGDPNRFQLMRVAIASGERTRVLESDGFTRIVADAGFVPRYASKPGADGSSEWFVRQGNAWRPWSTVPNEGAPGGAAPAITAGAARLAVTGLSADGRTLYLADNRGGNSAALYALDTTSGARKLLLEGARPDPAGLMVHPVTGLAQAARSTGPRSRWVALDPAIAPDLQRLETLAEGGEFSVSARTRADDTWVVNLNRPDGAARTYLYDRSSGNAKLWFDSRPALAGLSLAPMRAVEFNTRVGISVPAGLTLPPGVKADAQGKPERPLPMVLLVADGSPTHADAQHDTRQWLANRGYAVLSVGLRDSTGFDKTAANAGSTLWGRQMHEHLLDAVAWAVAGGIAQRDKVAIVGDSDAASGYAALARLAMTPREFACAVAFVGPGNLGGLLETLPRTASPAASLPRATGEGSPQTEPQTAGTTTPASPEQPTERPLLIGQGASPLPVNQAESDSAVRAMRERGMSPTYLLFPDEGSRLMRSANRISFYAAAEPFLATCLGGRAEPLGDDFKGASIQALAGADRLPATGQALVPAAPPR